MHYASISQCSLAFWMFSMKYANRVFSLIKWIYWDGHNTIEGFSSAELLGRTWRSIIKSWELCQPDLSFIVSDNFLIRAHKVVYAAPLQKWMNWVGFFCIGLSHNWVCLLPSSLSWCSPACFCSLPFFPVWGKSAHASWWSVLLPRSCHVQWINGRERPFCFLNSNVSQRLVLRNTRKVLWFFSSLSRENKTGLFFQYMWCRKYAFRHPKSCLPTFFWFSVEHGTISDNVRVVLL